MNEQQVRRANDLLNLLAEIVEWQNTPGDAERKKFTAMKMDFAAVPSCDAGDDGPELTYEGAQTRVPMDLYDAMLGHLRGLIEADLTALGVDFKVVQQEAAGNG